MTKMCLVMALIHNVELKIYNKNYPFLSLAKETSAYLTLITLQTVLLMFTKCSCQFFFFFGYGFFWQVTNNLILKVILQFLLV